MVKHRKERRSQLTHLLRRLGYVVPKDATVESMQSMYRSTLDYRRTMDRELRRTMDGYYLDWTPRESLVEDRSAQTGYFRVEDGEAQLELLMKLPIRWSDITAHLRAARRPADEIKMWRLYLRRLTQWEIAHELGCSQPTVFSRLKRSIELLDQEGFTALAKTLRMIRGVKQAIRFSEPLSRSAKASHPTQLT